MLLTLLQWIQNTAFFSSLRASAYVYPAVLALHLSAIALSGGMVVLANLRLLGWTLQRIPAKALLDALRVPKRIGFLVAAIFGTLLFCCYGEQYYYNGYFRIKLVLLFLACVHALRFHR